MGTRIFFYHPLCLSTYLRRNRCDLSGTSLTCLYLSTERPDTARTPGGSSDSPVTHPPGRWEASNARLTQPVPYGEPPGRRVGCGVPASTYCTRQHPGQGEKHDKWSSELRHPVSCTPTRLPTHQLDDPGINSF